jgi:glycosyltransferase involved in cell wall biosynthesis
MDGDPRISYFRQPENRGAVFNVNFVLEQSSGEYFMWAADDDLFGKDFVSRCLEEFRTEGGLVAVTMEAHYFSEEKNFEFFPEGREFYAFAAEHPEERLRHMIRYAYGNLFYSLYRRQALVQNGTTLYSRLSAHGLNEIPFFLVVVEQGNWRVIPRIGFCKKTSGSVYLQARWEMTGGILAGKGIMRYLGQMKADLVYHYHSFKDINQAISLLHARNKAVLRFAACWSLAKHCCFLALHYKPRVGASAPDPQPGSPKSH